MSKRGYFFVRLIFFRGKNFDGFVKVGAVTLSLSKGEWLIATQSLKGGGIFDNFLFLPLPLGSGLR
jgi:hypothetical protein